MVKIYCDGANLSDFERYADDALISGFTSNPSLMRKAGIKDYRTFAKTVLSLVKGKPVSFEVLSDDWAEMERQANEIQSWGDNVYVKIPIMNSRGESCLYFIEQHSAINLNVTAVLSHKQIQTVRPLMLPNHVLSIFVGRINDAGYSVPDFSKEPRGGPQLLWASTRQVYSRIDAANKGYDIITMTPELVEKISLHGKDLTEYSRETVEMFFNDGKGLQL